GLQRLLTKALHVNAQEFGTVGPGDEQVAVSFPDGPQDSQLELAQTVQMLYSAQAASTRVRVQMMHPDWDKDTVDAEVAEIMAEFSLSDPDRIGVDGFNLSGAFAPE